MRIIHSFLGDKVTYVLTFCMAATYSDIDLFLKMILSMVSIAYVTLKFYQDWRKNRPVNITTKDDEDDA